MEFFLGFLSGIFCLFILVCVPFLTPNHVWHVHAVARGYGEYCIPDGNFAWKGECKK